MTEQHLAKLANIKSRLEAIHVELAQIEQAERDVFATDGDAKRRDSRVEALHDATTSVDEAVQHIAEAQHP